jgi:signal transduction histidine kinase
MLREHLQVSRERLEFWYSIAVLAIIPILIALNTLLLMGGLRNSFDEELRAKAELVSHVIESTSAQNINDSKKTQENIDRITKDRSDITDITIAKKTSDGQLKIVGSTDKALIGKSADDLQFSIAISKDRAVAQLLGDKNSTRHWSVISPIHDISGKQVGAQNISVSLATADASISNLLLRSFVILGVSIIVVVLLLLNHFKFFEYAMLFKKLEEVDQLKSDFLSVATHELKAPMTIIKGNIENISDGLYGKVDDKIKQALGTMYDETNRLNNLVSDLLNVSKIEQEKLTYNISSVDISVIISKIAENYRQKARDKGIEIIYDLSSAKKVRADEERVIEIMTNLIDNAVKYSRHGSINISHKVVNDKLRTSVRDTGIGMSAKEREKLFNRFYRVQNDKTKDIGGTGLGLWIIKQYIEHMGGSIYVDSMEGVGSEFIVELIMDEKNLNNSQTKTSDGDNQS